MKLGHQCKSLKGRAAIRHYANQPAHPLWPLSWRPNFSVFNVKAIVGTFNQEKAFSVIVIVKSSRTCEPSLKLRLKLCCSGQGGASDSIWIIEDQLKSPFYSIMWILHMKHGAYSLLLTNQGIGSVLPSAVCTRLRTVRWPTSCPAQERSLSTFSSSHPTPTGS